MKKVVKKVVKKKPSLKAKIAELEERLHELEMTDRCGHALVDLLSKPKEPQTFEDCVNTHKTAFFVGGSPMEALHVKESLNHGLGVPSEKRAKQLAAIAKMMTVADALNGDALKGQGWYSIYVHSITGRPFTTLASNQCCRILFDDEHAAEKAIKILGEETIKTAFGL